MNANSCVTDKMWGGGGGWDVPPIYMKRFCRDFDNTNKYNNKE